MRDDDGNIRMIKPDTGDGVILSSDGTTAHRVEKGSATETISQEEAMKILEKLQSFN